MFIFLWLFSNRNESADVEIFEPDLPISQEVKISVLGESIEDSQSPIDVNSNEIEDQQETGTQQETEEIAENNGLPGLSFSELGEIVSVDVTPNEKFLLALTANTNSNFTSQNNSDTNNSSGYTLSLLDQNGAFIRVIESDFIISARFESNDKLIYQKIVGEAGIYNYDINTNSSEIITYTYDTTAFSNFFKIDTDRFFYIQNNTGKLGIINSSSNENKVIAEKIIRINNYINTSAYDYAKLSTDKSKVAFIDNEPDDNNQINLIVLPTSANNISEKLFETKVSAMNIQPGVENPLTWSIDDKYLYTAFGLLIDTDNWEIKSNESDNKKIFNLDNSKYLELNMFDGSLTFDDQNIESNVSDVMWLNNELVLVIIGQRLYVYSTVSNELFSVNETRANYNFESGKENKIWLRADNNIITVQPL